MKITQIANTITVTGEEGFKVSKVIKNKEERDNFKKELVKIQETFNKSKSDKVKIKLINNIRSLFTQVTKEKEKEKENIEAAEKAIDKKIKKEKEKVKGDKLSSEKTLEQLTKERDSINEQIAKLTGSNEAVKSTETKVARRGEW
jgi:dGTP triphosphohydrolase